MDRDLKRKRSDFSDSVGSEPSSKRSRTTGTIIWTTLCCFRDFISLLWKQDIIPSAPVNIEIAQIIHSPKSTSLPRPLTPKFTGPPVKLLELHKRKAERDYKVYANHMANKHRLFEADDDLEIVETGSTPKITLTSSSREYQIRQHEELRKLASAYERKERSLYESLKVQIESEATFEPPDLTDQQEKQKGPQHEVLVDKFNIEIRREDLCKLKSGQWLNDEIINFYMELLGERNKNIKFFNSHFYSVLTRKDTGYFYNSVARWTKSADLFAMSKAIIPIHVHGNHWCLAVINNTEKRLEYYDSLGGTNTRCLEILKRYYSEEHKSKKGSDIDMSHWQIQSLGSKTPQQKNAVDCGVFMLKSADFLSQNKRLNFSQRNMEFFRKQIALQIVHAKLDV